MLTSSEIVIHSLADAAVHEPGGLLQELTEDKI